MGDPFEPRFSLFEKPNSVFGDQYTLRLDPDIEAELNRLKYKLVFDRLESSLYRPDWSVIDLMLHADVKPPAKDAASPFQLLPPGAPKQSGVPSGGSSPQISEPANPTLRKGEASDILQALWKIPSVEAAINDMTGQLERTWNSMGTGDKTAVISTAAVIGGAAVSGIVSNDMTRTWVLQKLSGVYIPVPKVDGLKFSVTAPTGVIRGGGVSYENKMLSVKAGYERATLPDNTQFNDLKIEFKLDVGEAFHQIGKAIK